MKGRLRNCSKEPVPAVRVWGHDRIGRLTRDDHNPQERLSDGVGHPTCPNSSSIHSRRWGCGECDTQYTPDLYGYKYS